VFNPNHLRTFLAAYPDVKRYWVGLSGGLDSVALLHALASLQLPAPLMAVHIHHGLSPHADAWQQYCEDLCRTFKVPLQVERVVVEPAGEGIEAAARRARYQAYTRVTAAGDALLVAHHRQDQAETVLLRLLRGSGPRGLGAMPVERPLGQAQLLRPLLDVNREDLEAYVRAQEVNWVEDESNTDSRFDRNFLRRDVWPLIQQRWPEAASALSTSAALCRDSDALLAEMAREDLLRLNVRQESLGSSVELAGLSALSVARRQNLLRHWLRDRELPLPNSTQLQELEQQFFSAAEPQHGHQVNWSDYRACAFAERFYILHQQAFWRPVAQTPTLVWPDIEQPLALPGGDSLHWQQAGRGEGIAAHWRQRVQVRWREGGERCHPAGREHSQSLKKLLQEYGVAPWLRSRVPLLYVDEQLAGVADLWICKDFLAAANEVGYRCQWQL